MKFNIQSWVETQTSFAPKKSKVEPTSSVDERAPRSETFGFFQKALAMEKHNSKGDGIPIAIGIASGIIIKYSI